jgi:hypothetical protein
LGKRLARLDPPPILVLLRLLALVVPAGRTQR